jgi:hypothetical protein
MSACFYFHMHHKIINVASSIFSTNPRMSLLDRKAHIMKRDSF